VKIIVDNESVSVMMSASPEINDMKTTAELIQQIESEINMTGQTGLAIATLIARLDYAEKTGRSALRNLQTVYESIGNDAMTESSAKYLKEFNYILA
jgi:transcriptional regulator